MSNEIKEAIMQFQTAIDFKEAPMPMDYSINLENAKILLDCITNLQRELESKNNEIDVLKDQVKWWEQQCDDLEMQIGEQND